MLKVFKLIYFFYKVVILKTKIKTLLKMAVMNAGCLKYGKVFIDLTPSKMKKEYIAFIVSS